MNSITMKMQADKLIRMALQEDITSEDVSTNAVMRSAVKGTVDLIAKEDGIIAGLDVYARVFQILDEKTEIDFHCKDGDEVKRVTKRLKELEYEGYQFEGAEGTVELLIRKTIGKYKPFFKLNHFKTIGENPWNNDDFTSTALINITVDGKREMTAAEGDGPVNALDKALRKALEVFYPELKSVKLVDYKVRVLDSESTTGAKVRVLIESTDGNESWSTVGVSKDVIQASWIALVDSMEYKLIKDIERKAKAYF